MDAVFQTKSAKPPNRLNYLSALTILYGTAERFLASNLSNKPAVK